MGDWHTYASHAYYIDSEGNEQSSRSQYAVGITEGDLILYAQAYSSRLPPGYFIGVAKKESGVIGDLIVTNEHDVDDQRNDETGETRQYNSYGIFQMGKTEAIKAHVLPTADALIDAENNVKCAAVNFESNLDKILAADRENRNDSGDREIDNDVLRYCAWGHNAGISEPVTSIEKYGLDWNSAISRQQNDWFVNKLIPYTDEIISEVIKNAGIPFGDGASNTVERDNGFLLIASAGVLYWLLERG
jgi:hypothetical protein